MSLLESRFCSYCRRDAPPLFVQVEEEAEGEHSFDCPVATGVFPSEELPLGPDGETASCVQCDEIFDGAYTLQFIDEEFAVANAICLGCAATNAFLTDDDGVL